MPKTIVKKYSLIDHIVGDGLFKGPKIWALDRIRRGAVSLIPTSLIVLAAVVISGYLNVKTGNFLQSGIAADVMTKLIVGVIEFTVVVFGLFLMYAMYAALIYVVPLFSTEIPVFEPRQPPNLEAGETWEDWLYKGLRVGRWRGPSGSREPGGIVRIPIMDEHLIIGAVTRHGKSMMLWTIIYELVPAILAGAVELIIFDPKSGMELYAAVKKGWCKPENFFHGQGAGEVGPDGKEITVEMTYLRALRNIRDQMRKRGSQIIGKDQRHHAKPGSPHRIILIDEGASMVRASTDLGLRKAIVGCIEDICQMGAAAGYTVIVATQHPDIRQIPFRHALTYGLCGRVKTWQASEMLLGEGSYAKGARGDKLPRKIKGTWYTSNTGAWIFRGCRVNIRFTPKPKPGAKEPVPEKTDEPSNEELAAVIPFRKRMRELVRPGKRAA